MEKHQSKKKTSSRNAMKESKKPVYLGEPCDVCGVWPCAHTDQNSWKFDNNGQPSLAR